MFFQDSFTNNCQCNKNVNTLLWKESQTSPKILNLIHSVSREQKEERLQPFFLCLCPFGTWIPDWETNLSLIEEYGLLLAIPSLTDVN